MKDDKIAEIRARHQRIETTDDDALLVSLEFSWANADREWLLAEVEKLRAKIERLRTVYVLLVSEEAGPVDSATCWYEDKIIGCYISREAAEGAAKLLMADWRINEYALEAKP